MKHRVPAVLLLLLVTACAGVKAREHILWPSVKSTWPPVKEDIELGLQGSSASPSVMQAMNQIEGAVRADDYTLLKGANYFVLEPLARSGVRERVTRGMSEGVAASLDERNTQFSAAMTELTKR